MTAVAAAPTTVPAYAKGFETVTDEVANENVAVSGSLPQWLEGSLLRTGPARWEVGENRMRHWFDGLAMLHRFTIEGGRVSYASRFMRGRTYDAAQEGKIAYPEFATDPCRSLFKRVQTMFKGGPTFGDSPNINVTRLGERYIAMTESPVAIEFDAKTLESAGVAYEPPGILTTAHPHMDRGSKGMLNYAAKLGPRNQYRFFHLAPDSDKPEILARHPVREPAYMHSFGLTERWFILAEFPLVVNPVRLATSGRPYIENYRWKPELGTRFTLLDRKTGEATGPFRTGPFFAFHFANAYEDGDDVVADICTYDNAGVIEDLYLDRLRAGKAPEQRPELRRFRIHTGSNAVTHEQLVDESMELPRINYGRANERDYRYVWGVGSSPDSWIDRIVKADVVDRTTTTWSEPGSYPGEPVFVRNPDGTEEDDGVLLSIVLDSERDASFMLVLDAADLSELARAEVADRVPFGFHAQFDRSIEV